MALTEQQKAWFATLKKNLEAETGRSLAEWAEIAKTCPETKHRAKLAWFKEKYGLGMNRASVIMKAAESPDGKVFGGGDEAYAALWQDEKLRAVHDAVAKKATALEGVTTGQRKGFTAFSRNYQFAATRPAGGAVRLGLAVPPDVSDRLEAPKKSEGWSERLKSVLVLNNVKDIDSDVAALLKAAWTKS